MNIIQYINAVIKLPVAYKNNYGIAKMLLILLLVEKENGKDIYCYEAFLNSFPQYKNIEKEMIDEKILIKKKEVKLNRLSTELNVYLSYLPKKTKKANIDSILKKYNNIWAGLFGIGSTENTYRLLDTKGNKIELYKFIVNNEEFDEETILGAAKFYLQNLEVTDGKYRFATKSNNFIINGGLLDNCLLIQKERNRPKKEGKDKYKGNTYFIDL